MCSDTNGFVDHHNVVVVIDDAQARYGLRRRSDCSRGWLGQLYLKPLPFVQTVALAGLRAVEHDAPLGRELGGARTAEAEKPCQPCIDAFALEPLRHRQGPYLTHREERRRP